MSNKKKKLKALISRRELLGMTAATMPVLFSPTRMLLKGLVDGFIQKAIAYETGNPVKNLINFHIYGAPCRWYWDGFFSPYKNNMPTPSTGMNGLYNTRFKAAPTAYTAPEYATFVHQANVVDPATGALVAKNIYLPQLWAGKIPTSSGPWVPMTNLLDNWLTIRGLSNPIPLGHPSGAIAQTRPNSSAPSLLGSVADASSLPLPAVTVIPYYSASSVDAFKGNFSTQVLAHENSVNPNPLGEVLGIFDSSNDSAGSVNSLLTSQVDAMVAQALADVSNYADSESPGAAVMQKMQNEAKIQLQAGIGGAIAAYPALYNKYNNLISAVVSGVFGANPTNPIPQITDLPIPLPPTVKDSAGNTWPPVQNVMALNGSFNFVTQNADLRNFIGSTSAGKMTAPRTMAASFAIIEYLICNGYSAAVTGGTNAIDNVVTSNVVSWNPNMPAVPGSGFSWNYDEHGSGSHASLIANAFMYTCLSACLFELIGQLKNAPGNPSFNVPAGDLFAHTVIMITGDFHRAPGDQRGSVTQITGSQHDSTSMVVTALSGCLSGVTIIGDVVLGNDPARYSPALGNYGTGIPITVNAATRLLTLHDSTSTIAWLCGTQAPFSNVPSLLAVSSSTNLIMPVINLADEK